MSDETPAQGASKEAVARIEDKFKEVGLDLTSADPQELAEAVEFAKQWRGRAIADASDIEAKVNERLREVLVSPEGRKIVADGLGLAEPGESEDLGVEERRLRQIETHQRAIAQALQKMIDKAEQGERREQARESIATLQSHLGKAEAAIPGSEDHPKLRKLFWQAVKDGEIPKDATPAQVRRWVKAEVDDWGESISRVTKARSTPKPVDAGVALSRVTDSARVKDKNGSYADEIAQVLNLVMD